MCFALGSPWFLFRACALTSPKHFTTYKAFYHVPLETSHQNWACSLWSNTPFPPAPQFLRLFNFLPVTRDSEKATLGPQRVNVAQNLPEGSLSAGSTINSLFPKGQMAKEEGSLPGGQFSSLPKTLPLVVIGRALSGPTSVSQGMAAHTGF